MDQEVIDCALKASNSEELRGKWEECVRGKGFRENSPLSERGAAFALIRKTVKGEAKAVAYPDQACHSVLNEVRRDERKDYKAIVNRLLPLDIALEYDWTKEGLIEYYRYISNDGPMAHVFVSKDAEDMIENGCILNLQEVIGCHLLMACQQTRYPWEVTRKPFGVKAYQLWVNQGVHPNLAAMACWGLVVAGHNKDTRYIDSISASNCSSGHSPFSWESRDKAQWLRLLTNVPNTTKTLLWRDGGYYGVHTLFDLMAIRTEADNKLKDALNAVIEKFKPTIQTKDAGNIFGSSQTITRPQDVDGLLSAIAEELVSFQEEILNG